jgi:hypothetical protein
VVKFFVITTIEIDIILRGLAENEKSNGKMSKLSQKYL